MCVCVNKLNHFLVFLECLLGNAEEAEGGREQQTGHFENKAAR